VTSAERYPLRNADEREGARLSLLQELSDPITVRWFERIGVAAGWRCLELGAGGGSMVEWLAERVGPGGSVTAVDQDTSRLGALAARHDNVRVVEGDLCALELPEAAFEIVHSRSVLMHLACPDQVVERAVRSLAPGGVVFFEETDGAPAQEASGAPEPFRLVFGPLCARWTWARGLARSLRDLGMVDVHEDVRQDALAGATPKAEFWKFTLGSVAELQEQALSSPERRAELEAQGIDPATLLRALPQMLELLDDPAFSAPFTARHRVVARRPG
jgi:SAM-dependent methyltransferase